MAGRGAAGNVGQAGGGGGGGAGGHGACVVPTGCCATDADCLPTEECVNPAVCVANEMTAGKCKPKPTSITTCWRNEDCPFHICTGAVVCPCGSECLRADEPGGCAMP